MRRGFFSENIMEIKIKLQNGEIAERACAFARNMNGVGSAEYDGEEIAITLSPNGSENVVRTAVEGYIEAMGGEKAEKSHSKLKTVLKIVTAALLAAVGAVTAHFGAETTSLFLYIAAYIIIIWDIFLSIAENIKAKRRPKLAQTAVGVLTLVMFVMGLYIPAIVIAAAGGILIRN